MSYCIARAADTGKAAITLVIGILAQWLGSLSRSAGIAVARVMAVLMIIERLGRAEAAP